MKFKSSYKKDLTRCRRLLRWNWDGVSGEASGGMISRMTGILPGDRFALGVVSGVVSEGILGENGPGCGDDIDQD